MAFSIRSSFYAAYGDLILSCTVNQTEAMKVKDYDGYQTDNIVYELANTLLVTNTGYPYFSTEEYDNLSAEIEGKSGTTYFYNSAFYNFVEEKAYSKSIDENGILLSEKMAEYLKVENGGNVKLHLNDGEDKRVCEFVVAGIYAENVFDYAYIINVEKIVLSNEPYYFFINVLDFNVYDKINDFCEKTFVNEYSPATYFDKMRSIVVALEYTFFTMSVVVFILCGAVIKELTEYILTKRKSYIFISKALGAGGGHFALIYSAVFGLMCILPLLVGFIFSRLALNVLSKQFLDLFGVSLLLKFIWLPPILAIIITLLIFLIEFVIISKYGNNETYKILRSNA